MEDAAKRRERLMALRSEAAQRSSGAAPPTPSVGASELPDPLFSSSPQAVAPTHPPRFDYYTNPSAAFSSAHNLNKRKNSSFQPAGSSPLSGHHARPNVGPHNYTGPNQPPIHQLEPQYYVPPHAPPPAHWINPAQFQHQPPWNVQRPASGHGSWQHSSGSPLGMPQLNQPRSGFQNPSFVRGSSPGPRPSNPNWNTYSGSRGAAGSGRGFHNRFGQSSYYSRSMVEDPWIELEPTVGNLVGSLEMSGSGSSSRSWLPESLRKKESTKPDKIGHKYEKKLSLAEYLDLSINETVGET